MALRMHLLLFTAGALFLLAESAPVEPRVGHEEDAQKLLMDSLDRSKPNGLHILERRSDKATTLEDALNIPIAALEAVSRLLTNRYGAKTPEEHKHA